MKDGWFKALREGKIEQWREQEKEKIQSEYKEKKSQFFRGDDSRDSGVGDSGRLISKTSGQFHQACLRWTNFFRPTEVGRYIT